MNGDSGKSEIEEITLAITILTGLSFILFKIADYFNISKPSISFHLKILKNAQLIESRKIGQNIIYSLQMSVFEETVNLFFNFMSTGGRNEK